MTFHSEHQPSADGMTCVDEPHPSPENLAGKLDAKGRCCGRKPLAYKGGPRGRGEKRHRFCCRCDRAYHFDTGEQIENWAFKKCPGSGCWISGSASACGEYLCEEESA